MKQNKERPLQASRRASSCPLKGIFSNVEGRLLASSSAFPLKERRMISEISWQSLKTEPVFFFSQKCILFLKKCILFSQRLRSFLTKGAFYFSQKNTEEQNTQSFTETLSQPNSQNVTANVSWKASVFSVCRRRSVGSKRAQKGSVNSVSSVREKTPKRVVCVLYHTVGAFYFSQKNTEEQNTQSFTETLSQPNSQNLTATFS